MITAGQLMVVSLMSTDNEFEQDPLVIGEMVVRKHQIPDALDSMVQGIEDQSLPNLTLSIYYIPPATAHYINISDRIPVLEMNASRCMVAGGQLIFGGPITGTHLEGGDGFRTTVVSLINKQCRYFLLDVDHLTWEIAYDSTEEE